MLRSIKSYEGHLIQGADGEIGSVTDFFFDDVDWSIRYLVVDTGKWIPGRRALISPLTLERLADVPASFFAPVTKEIIEKSPPFDAEQAISRQYETELTNYYGWPAYWEGFKLSMASSIGKRSDVLPDDVKRLNLEQRGVSNLWSANEVIGYFIEATDGEIGHVEDFVLEDETWAIRYMVIDTRNWLPGRKVLIIPQLTEGISWTEAKVRVELPRETVKESPEFDPNAPINRQYEVRLYDYYGRPAY